MLSKVTMNKDYWFLKGLLVQKSQMLPRNLLDDRIVSNNGLIDLKVRGSLMKTMLFQTSNDCKGIQCHYSNGLD